MLITDLYYLMRGPNEVPSVMVRETTKQLHTNKSYLTKISVGTSSGPNIRSQIPQIPPYIGSRGKSQDHIHLVL